AQRADRPRCRGDGRRRPRLGQVDLLQGSQRPSARVLLLHAEPERRRRAPAAAQRGIDPPDVYERRDPEPRGGRQSQLARRWAEAPPTRRAPQSPLPPMNPVAFTSTTSRGVASARTSTRVEVGKSPVKNSRRAFHTSSRCLMSVT